MKITFTVEKTYEVDMEQELFDKIYDMVNWDSDNYNPSQADEELESFCNNVMDLQPDKCIERLVTRVEYHANPSFSEILYEI